MRLNGTVLVVGLVLVPAATAQQPTATYQVDTTASRVFIKVGSAGRLGHDHGVVGNLASGTIRPGGGGELVFDTTSFTADTPEARAQVGLDPKANASDAQKVTANMRGPDVLHVAKYPQAVFAITAMTPAGGQQAGEGGAYHLTGQFTLHGTTKPLKITAALEPIPQSKSVRLKGTFSILQTQFGITPYSALAGLARVADTLQIWGDVVLTPAP